MRRFVSFAVLLLATVPFGASIVGCGHKTVTVFCNGGDSGPIVGQVKSITLAPQFATYGESIDFGNMGTALSASAVDCKGSPVSVNNFTYATTDMSFADINPSNGVVCGGTYNRNVGGGIPDYSICTAPVIGTSLITAAAVKSNVLTFTSQNSFFAGQQVRFTGLTRFASLNNQALTIVAANTTSFTVNFTNADLSVVPEAGSAVRVLPSLAYVTATANGAVSNAIPVYVHPVVTSVVIGNPTAQASCTAALANPLTSDPSTNCCPASGSAITATPYTGTQCLSQGMSGQLAARVYRNGTTNPVDNITCSIGHINFAAQNSSIFTVDQNGVVTAQQPGSTLVTAALTNSGTGSAAGFFATCPPASIQITSPTQVGNSLNVNLNTTQPIVATVKDTNNVTLTGVNLTYTSTTPSTIGISGGQVTPIFPGAGAVTAICLPPTCNAAPFSQIGLFGNGTPITSNSIQINTPGTNATVLYIASTNSQFVLPVDFSTGQQGSLLKLPYTPNSIAISPDGSTIYFGSTVALMTVSAFSNTVLGANLAIPGTVLAVSPDGTTVAVTDPARQTVSLVTNGSITSTYGGVGTRAQFTPDSQTVYVTTNTSQLLVHTLFTGWYSTPTSETYTDLAVTVPSVGAFFAGGVTEGRSVCPASTIAATGTPPAVSNQFFPLANTTATRTDRVSATNDGAHILGASAATSATAALSDIRVTLPTGACPAAPQRAAFTSTVNNLPLTAISATSITGVPVASNSALAFVTYTGSGGVLPRYVPSAAGTGPGTLTYLILGNGANAASTPVSGVFSTDNSTFYAGTSGDNQVHLFTITGTAAVESSVITPKLPDANNNPAVPNLLVQRPKQARS